MNRFCRIAVLVLLGVLAGGGAARSAPSDLFISEYIEGTSNNKALEIYNGTGAPVSLTTGGYNVQMFFNGSSSAGLTINLVGTVASGDVFVLAQSSASAAILAQADQTNGAGWFNGDDAVVLRKGGAGGPILDVIGQVGFDPGTEWGTGLTSTADNTLRRKPTIQAGDTNPSDAFDPSVEWEGLATDTFGGLGAHTITTGGDAAPSVVSTSPPNGGSEVATTADIVVNFSEPVAIASGWYAISCSSSGAHTAMQSGGPQSYTLDPDADFVVGENCTVTVDATKVTDVDTDDPPDQMAANHVFTFTTTLPVTQIGQVQGASHISPFAGQRIKVEGVVTATRTNGYWMGDPTPDADNATSEGLFVFTSSAPTVNVGDAVQTVGTVSEFRPGGSTSTNLTITELTSPSTAVQSSGNPLPAPTVAGTGGRIPPDTIIEDDATGSVETSGTFDPASDGIDFWESLESMRVQLNDAVAVGPTSGFGEIPVVGDDSANAGPDTSRGGVVITPTDFNPERILLDDTLLPTPLVNVGDGFTTAVVGVLDYSFGNFKLDITASLTRVDNGLQREVTRAPIDQEIVVGTYNVENLDPGDGAAAFARHADLIVNHLRSPDLIAIEEIQDNNGATNDSVTDASQTWSMLIAAIQAAGGPAYEYRQIDPADDQDGGEPGGNIRVGFLFRSDRGLNFIDRSDGGSSTATTVIDHPSGPRLSSSPGRVDPQNSAWASSRKPLAGEFRMHGKKVFVIANHFNSKGGDQPLFGRFQPPERSSEVQRHQQAQVVNNFVDSILAADPAANVIVLGDLNDFEFSETVSILGGGVLTSLMETLPKAERYSYVFEGNSQVLDQVLVSDNLLDNFPIDYDPVHVNSEFADQASDHEPQVARLDLRGRPTP